MQKLKKALKKLAKIASPKGATGGVKRTEARAAKKATAVKKKTAPMAAKKAASSTGLAKKKATAGKAAPSKATSKSIKAAKPSKAVPSKAVGAKAGASKASATKAPLKKAGAKALSAKAPSKEEKSSKKAAEAEAKAAKASATKAAPDKAGKAARGGDRSSEGAPETKSRKPADRPAEAESLAAADDADEVILTDAEGRRYCRVRECDQIANVDAYCRYHYLLFWKKIQVRKKILSEGKLDRYIEDLTARYPDKYLEMLRKDLRNEKDFMAAIQELEIDDSGVDNEYEDEAQSYLEEVRGMGSENAQERTDEEY